jgi:hypothetical protein
MLFRAIQKYDPFNSADKAAAWETIAEAMGTATATLDKEADGDFRVYSSGKTLSVFYQRCRDKEKKDEAEGHSGHAGKAQDSPAKAEERMQLAGCMEAERSAKEAGEKRREAQKGYDVLRKGEVNDMIIALAKDHENIKSKAIKVLSSKLRKAKMAKMAYEAEHKDGKYTYTPEDLANFEHWRSLKANVDNELPDDPTESDSVGLVEKRGGAMANAIVAMTDKLTAAATQFQPIDVSHFANAFYAAKRAHDAEPRRSLKEKLQIVDEDAEQGIITIAVAEQMKSKITEQHYLSLL